MKRAETHPRSDLKYFSSMKIRVSSGDVDLKRWLILMSIHCIQIYIYILKFNRYNLPPFPGFPGEM